MRKIILNAILCVSAFAGIYSCSNKKQQMEILQEVKPGMFAGELPCADCPGILTFVTIHPDSTIAVTSLYVDEDGASFTDYGKWMVKDSLIVGVFDSGNLYYLPKSDTVIALVDKDGRESAFMPQKYLLKRIPEMSADSFQGEYIQTGLEGEGYKQFMVVEKVSDHEVMVKITFTGKKNGCTFTGEGEIVNNQIEIDLNKIDPNLKSTMVIRPVADQVLNVFTSRYDDRNDLSLFCTDDGSLIGDYHKITSQSRY